METSTLANRPPRWTALACAWLQDYLYAGAWQLRSLLPSTAADRLRAGCHRAAEPVVLVPGIWESWKFMLPLATALHQAGHPVHVIPQLGFNRGTVPEMSQVVSRYLVRAQLEDAVLVAHSKGGLIGKYLMAASLQGYRINRMIAIGTPFSGSRYARYAPIRALRSLSPNDQGLLKLSANLSVNSPDHLHLQQLRPAHPRRLRPGRRHQYQAAHAGAFPVAGRCAPARCSAQAPGACTAAGRLNPGRRRTAIRAFHVNCPALLSSPGP